MEKIIENKVIKVRLLKNCCEFELWLNMENLVIFYYESSFSGSELTDIEIEFDI